MSDYYYSAYPVAYAASQPESACTSLLRFATLGALVGGSAAAAGNFRRVRAQEIGSQQALVATGKAALASGVATALAGAVVSSINDQGGVLRLGLMFGTGAAAVYAINHWLEGDGNG